MNDLVDFSVVGNVGVITINNPPVNALAQAVRQGIQDGVNQGVADAAVEALVIVGGGRTFIAGADISEFGKPLAAPDLNSVLTSIEDSSKPVVAALHGTALGGGLEVALACHYRCAVAQGEVGLPEVKLGLLPGAGGTQRLPRLVGPEAAADMIISGNPVPAPKAAELGIVDEIVEGDLTAAAAAYAARLVAEKAPHRRIRDMDEKVARARRRGAVRWLAQEIQPSSARPTSALRLPGKRAERRRVALRRGHEERARDLHRPHGVPRIGGASLRFLRRTRGQQNPRRPQGHAGA